MRLNQIVEVQSQMFAGMGEQTDEVRYRTREEQLACEHGTPIPYFRLEDSLCESFLQLATDPQEFAGLRLLFPFFREASVLRVPRSPECLDRWIVYGFIAGYDLGRTHPHRVDDVLPRNELRETLHRLGVLRAQCGQAQLTYGGLREAAHEIAAERHRLFSSKLHVESAALELTLKSLRAGFAAATVAQSDPVYCEFVWDVPDQFSLAFDDVFSRAWCRSPLNAVGKSVAELLEHPLLKMAREHYPNRPAERQTILAFFREQFCRLGIRSENECPTSDADLIEWIGCGLKFGNRIKADQPQLLQGIIGDWSQDRIEGAARTVRDVISRAGGISPAQLLGPAKEYQEKCYGGSTRDFYGGKLAQVLYLCDLAIWIPWIGKQGGNSAKQTTHPTA